MTKVTVRDWCTTPVFVSSSRRGRRPSSESPLRTGRDLPTDFVLKGGDDCRSGGGQGAGSPRRARSLVLGVILAGHGLFKSVFGLVPGATVRPSGLARYDGGSWCRPDRNPVKGRSFVSTQTVSFGEAQESGKVLDAPRRVVLVSGRLVTGPGPRSVYMEGN